MRYPGICQNCGSYGNETTPIHCWTEHDDKDRPTRTVVCLCIPCAQRIIEPHPRLYSRIEPNTPVPGAMPNLCRTCPFRNDLTCTHPKLKANGGKGLCIITPTEPTRGFWDGCNKQGRHIGGSFVHYPNPPIFCEGNPTAGDSSRLTDKHREIIQQCLDATQP